MPRCLLRLGPVLAVLALTGGPALAAQQPEAGELFLGAAGAAGEPAADTDAWSARGVVEPARQALISGEIAARIVALPFRDGEAFSKGDRLVGFDCTLFEARRRQAAAALEAARIKSANAEQLRQMNSIGELEVKLAEAEVRRSSAVVAEAAAAVERCTIKAPYDGRVVEALVNTHEVAAPGAELLSIVSAEALEATLLVPSRWLVWLVPGSRFSFAVDETGTTLAGRVATLGARVDPVSQTVPVRALLEGDAGGLVPGMSGTARFERGAPAVPGG